jgi:hypothetical protein
MEPGACVSHHLSMSAETSITQADASLWGHLPASLGNGADLDAWAQRRRSTTGGGSTREEKRRVGRPRAKEKKKETLHKAVDETCKQAGRRNIAWAQLPFSWVPAAKVDQPRGIGVWTSVPRYAPTKAASGTVWPLHCLTVASPGSGPSHGLAWPTGDLAKGRRWRIIISTMARVRVPPAHGAGHGRKRETDG